LISCAALSALALAAALSVADRADACSCIAPNHARDVQRHAVAFRGVARGIRPIDARTEEVTFEVLARWNGVAPTQRTIRVRRPLGNSMCPIPEFRLRRRYAVYAERNASGELTVSGCNPSHAE